MRLKTNSNFINLFFFLYLVIFLNSCSDTQKFKNEFSTINKLNLLIISASGKIADENTPDSIIKLIPKSRDYLNILQKKLNLCAIEKYNFDGGKSIGIAYKFNCKNNQKDIFYYMIYSQDKGKMISFKNYEQFIECAGQINFDQNWTFVQIKPDCID